MAQRSLCHNAASHDAAPPKVLQAAGPQHCCHTPSVAVTGRQCHNQPGVSLSAPVFTVSEPYSLRVVSSFVASFAKVPWMSVAKHTHVSCLSRYGACLAHSAHAPAMVGSTRPGPLGSCL